jgi:hypothetical protein
MSVSSSDIAVAATLHTFLECHLVHQWQVHSGKGINQRLNDEYCLLLQCLQASFSRISRISHMMQ